MTIEYTVASPSAAPIGERPPAERVLITSRRATEK